jgi:peroxiredoxin (alkyl hydroperoxide reductase subunit C)
MAAATGPRKRAALPPCASGDDRMVRAAYTRPCAEEKPMPIQAGETIPSTKLTLSTPDGPKESSTDELFGGKTVVLFGVPGAFTPTCSARHLPSFVEQAEALKAKGADVIACVAVNDAFVLNAWARDQGVEGKIVMVADGSAEFIRKLGLEMDLAARGLGVRSQRFALVAKDRKVAHIGVEAPGAFEVSKAEAMLEVL